MNQQPGTSRIVPLMDLRTKSVARPLAELATSSPIASDGSLMDARGRPLRDLRISVTDRCNFRCSYCMPKEVFDSNYKYLPQQSLLTFEEIVRLARQFVNHGVRKIRLTGGEPLLRKNVELLIEQLASLRTPDGHSLDLTLTTNGSLLARKAAALKSAGLQRITVSLDGLNDQVFRQMNDVDFPVADVLEGIEAAHRAGLGPIKVNMVVKRGTNVQEILPMARRFKGSGIVVRYIEYMDVGSSNGWQLDEVVPSREVVEILKSEFPMVALDPAAPGETAQRWGYADSEGKHDASAGEIGVISSVTQAFCADCNRARLSTEGKVYLCLFASQGHDLRGLLRNGASDEQLALAIGHVWHSRDDRYSELRSAQGATVTPRVEMSYIGG